VQIGNFAYRVAWPALANASSGEDIDMANLNARSSAATVKTMGNAVGTGEDNARLTLDSRGKITDCNAAVETLFKSKRSALLRRHISVLLPQLAQLELVKSGQINPHLRFLIRIGRQFQALSQDGEHFASEIFLNVLGSAGSQQISLIVRPVEPSMSAVADPEATANH
jgi:PAS domain-containing protein